MVTIFITSPYSCVLHMGCWLISQCSFGKRVDRKWYRLYTCIRFTFFSHRLMSKFVSEGHKTVKIKRHNELNDLYCSPSIVRVIRSRILGWNGQAARMGERRGIYRVLVGKHEGKRPLGRPMRRWKDNTKMHLQDVGCGGLDWIEVAQDRER